MLTVYLLFESETFECVRGDLTQQLLTRINRTDAAHFYNLASLESTLLALMHITARYVTRRPDLRLGVSVNRTISSFSVDMNKSLWGLKYILFCFVLHVDRAGVEYVTTLMV